MNLKEAIRTIRINPKKEQFKTLTTIWGEALKPDSVLKEYPRPQMVRDSYINLNGLWNYAFTASKNYPSKFDGKILVPFSPESQLSGVRRQLKPHEFLWYETTFKVETPFKEHRCILHFGAVDQCCVVYINRRKVMRHVGGYLPFEVDITEYLKSGSNTLTLCVQDFSDTSYHSRGKQKLHRGGMFYTAVSGIWQTVFMEWVPETYIKKLFVTPDYESSTVKIQIISNKSSSQKMSVEIIDDGEIINQQTARLDHITLTIPNRKDWSPERPFLYGLHIRLGEDFVTSYFAMRLMTIEPDNHNIPRFCLNHKPIFLHGVLDQGYWPDGLYTAPSDDALIFDIDKAKSLGFNMIRKHIKIEPARWYYHCDRLGIIVWQDMVNGGTSYHTPFVTWLPTLMPWTRTHIKDCFYRLFSRRNLAGRKEWLRECYLTIEHLSHFPCISTWVPFNEGWGQFDADKVTSLIRKKDPTRLIDSTSGWFDQGLGDFKSEHNYFEKLKVVPDKRAFAISEYGGYACYIKEHSSINRIYGYKTFSTAEQFNEAYFDLIENQLKPLIQEGLCASVYTQLSDIEEEVNGIMTYDRRVVKLTKPPH